MDGIRRKLFGGNGLDRFVSSASIERRRREKRTDPVRGAGFAEFRKRPELLEYAEPDAAAGDGRTAIIAYLTGSGSAAWREARSFPSCRQSGARGSDTCTISLTGKHIRDTLRSALQWSNDTD